MEESKNTEQDTTKKNSLLDKAERGWPEKSAEKAGKGLGQSGTRN
jgi:hypothetical protein